MKIHKIFLFLVPLIPLIHSIPLTSDKSKGKRPPQLNFSEYRDKPLIVKVGSNVQLKCPILSEQFHTYYEWYRYGQPLEDYYNPRFKFGSKSGWLKIKNVKLSDSGPYTCEVVNGFGTKKIDINILVVPIDSRGSDETSITNYDHANVPSGANFRDKELLDEDEREDGDDELNNSAPDQVYESRESKRRINEASSASSKSKNTGKPYLINTELFNFVNKTVGENVKFQCSALGLPVPTIRWTYNDMPLDVSTLPTDSNVQGGHLFIHGVTLKSAGKYSCVAFNELGQDSADFELSVKEKQPEMHFMDNFPLESYEVQEGSQVTIKCRVRSPQLKPRIEWLRNDLILKEESSINTLGLQSLKPVPRHDNRLNLRIESKDDLVMIEDNLYERSITVKQTDAFDEGVYVCVSIIGKQFKYKSTRIIVNPFNSTNHYTNRDENYFGNLFPPEFLWIFGTIFLITSAVIFIWINCKTRSKVGTRAFKAIEMTKIDGIGGDRSGHRNGPIIEGSVDAFGDPINGRAVNTYTLINHRPQNYYWTRGRLDAWIDDSDKYTSSYRKSKCQHVCRTCKRSTSSSQHHSSTKKRKDSVQSDVIYKTRRYKFGQNNTSEDNYQLYQNLRKHEDVWRQKQRLVQIAQIQGDLRHDYSAIKYSLGHHDEEDEDPEVMAAPNNSPESNNS